MNPIFYGLYTKFQRENKQQYNEDYDESDNNDLPECFKYVIIGFTVFMFILIFV